jgi:sulfate adenylyltransferase subunit 1 (EFTu-like GTPase family)
MAAITMRHFDTLNFVKKSKELGASEALAEYQARQIEEAIDIAVITAKHDIENKELATKGDIAITRHEIKEVELNLQKEIAQTKYQMLFLMGSFGIFFLGILAKGFHWL